MFFSVLISETSTVGAWVQVSVDYLSKPMEIFKEMDRVLKPGGLAAMR